MKGMVGWGSGAGLEMRPSKVALSLYWRHCLLWICNVKAAWGVIFETRPQSLQSLLDPNPFSIPSFETRPQSPPRDQMRQ